MADILAFSPVGNTTALAVTTASGSIALPNAGDGYSGGNHRLTNAGPDDLFFAVASSAPTAAIPTNGTPANGVLLKAGTTEIFSFGIGLTLAAICPTTTATLYITGGQGT